MVERLPLSAVAIVQGSTAFVPCRAATTGAAFNLYAAGAVGAYLEGTVYTGQRATAGGTEDRLFRICKRDILCPWWGVGTCPRFSLNWWRLRRIWEATDSVRTLPAGGGVEPLRSPARD